MALRWTEEELKDYQARQKQQPKQRFIQTVPMTQRVTETVKRQKYGNRRVEVDGMKFDSQKEATCISGRSSRHGNVGRSNCWRGRCRLIFPEESSTSPILSL